MKSKLGQIYNSVPGAIDRVIDRVIEEYGQPFYLTDLLAGDGITDDSIVLQAMFNSADAKYKSLPIVQLHLRARN